MTLFIPVIRHKNAKAWPKHDTGAAATYVAYSDALKMHFLDREAFTCAYSVPDVKRRLAGDAYDHLDGGVTMQLLLLDIDAPSHTKTKAWAFECKQLIQRLFEKHPGGYCAESKGGFRVYYPLKTPHLINNIDDKLAWSRYYMQVLDYLGNEFGLECDEKCKDWCRLQRLPHDTRDGELQKLDTFGDITGGYGWELPHITPTYKTTPVPTAKPKTVSESKGGGSIPISKKFVRMVIKGLPEFAPTKVQLGMVLDGVSWSVSGDRDTSAMKMTWALAKKSSQLDPASITLLFEESISRIRADDPTFDIDVADMYSRACVKIEHDRSLTLADAPDAKISDKAIYNSDPEHIQHAQVSKALAAHPDLYSQAGEIVRVSDGSIVPIAQGMLPPLISSVVTYIGSKGAAMAVPQHVVRSVFSDTERDGWRDLLGTKESAAVRPDATVHSKPGYDSMTGVYLTNPIGTFEQPELEEAAITLAEPFADFIFDEGGRAGCIACVLTLIARDLLHDMGASVPAFIFTAPDSGSGKTTLAEICQIISGISEPGSMAYVSNSAEMEKRFQAHAMGDKACMYIDNWQTGAVVGGAMLDSMVTSKKTMQIRDFGKLRNTVRPWRSTILITGNQLEVRGDFTRRVVYISVHRQPRDYQFAIRELRTHVLANRVRYMAAATSLLCHHMVRARHEVLEFPSFEAWADLVGGAVVRAGFGDPTAGRKVLDESNDDVYMMVDAVQALADIWPDQDDRASYTSRELLDIPEATEVFEEIEQCLRPSTNHKMNDTAITARQVSWVLSKLNNSKQFPSVGVFIGTHLKTKNCRVWSLKRANQ